MRITIANRYRPFTHTPGLPLLLPGSNHFVRVYPSRLYIDDKLFDFGIEGPVKNFTTLLDLERGHIEVFGQAKSGPYRYRLKATLDGGCHLSGQEKCPLYTFTNPLRVHLGCHKQQEWDAIVKRASLREFLPFLLLHALHHSSDAKPRSGTASLFSALDQVSASPQIAGLYDQLFRCAYYGLLVPSLDDRDFHGISFPEIAPGDDPLGILPQTAESILRHFIRFEEHRIEFLPLLPPELHCGRITGFSLNQGNQLDMEWSKKSIKKAIIHIVSPQKVAIHAKAKRCRLRRSRAERGEWVSIDHTLEFEEPGIYLVDRFSS